MTGRTLTLVATALIATCGVAAYAQQAPDRSKPPAVGPAPALHVPAIDKQALSNGLAVRIVSLHKVPLVHIQLAIKAGGGSDPKQKFGLASLTAAMLDEGAGSRSALEIADAIDYLGADLSAASTDDASFVNLHVPSARLGEGLAIMADVVLRPSFQDTELKRVRDERLNSLLQAQDDPEQLIGFAFPRLLYGETVRYGTSTIGTSSSLQRLTVADLKAFHDAAYRPSNAELVVTGDVTADIALPLLEKAFGSWTGSASAATIPETAKAATTRRVFLIDKPDAAQSQIRIGGIGVARSTPDYFALRVLNTILGGSFTSRLNANLREQHGYSYGASSTFDMRLAAGPFYAAAGVQSDKTAEALKEFFVELNRIHELVPREELDKAASYLSLLLPHYFETISSVATSVSQLYVYGLADDFYATYADRVRAVTPADVKRVADKYIVPDKLTVVVIGDRKKIESSIRALNLGPLTIVEAGEAMK